MIRGLPVRNGREKEAAFENRQDRRPDRLRRGTGLLPTSCTQISIPV